MGNEARGLSKATLLRHTLLYFPAQLLGPAFQFIAAVAWTHFMAPDAYGALTFIIAAQELIFLIALAWWSQYMLRYIGKFETVAEREKFSRTDVAVLAASSLLQIFGAGAALLMVAPNPTFDLMAAAAAFVVLRSAIFHLGERARAGADILTYTLAQIFFSVVGFFVAFAFVALIAPTPTMALAGYAVAQAFGVAVMARRLGVRPTLSRPDRELIIKGLKFGAPIIVGGALMWVSGNVIRFVVERLGSLEQLGLIAVGWGLGQRLAATVANFLAAAAAPLAVRQLHAGDRAGALRQLSLNGAMQIGLIAPACIGLVAIAPDFIVLVIAEPFRAMTLATLPLATFAGACRNFRIHFADQAMVVFERPDRVIVLNAIDAALMILGCVAGFVLDGAIGSVAGASLASLAAALVGVAMTGTILRLWPSPWDLPKIALACAALAAALHFVPIQDFLHTPASRLVGLIGLGAAVYPLALAALYPRETFALLRRLPFLKRLDSTDT